MGNIRISLYLQCYGGIHSASSASNMMENIRIPLYLQCSGSIHGTSSASNTMENIRILLYLQCSGGIHGTSSASNTMENIRISLYLQCSGGVHGTSGASNTMENIRISLYLQCSGGIHGTSSASNTMEHKNIVIFAMFPIIIIARPNLRGEAQHEKASVFGERFARLPFGKSTTVSGHYRRKNSSGWISQAAPISLEKLYQETHRFRTPILVGWGPCRRHNADPATEHWLKTILCIAIPLQGALASSALITRQGDSSCFWPPPTEGTRNWPERS